MEEHSPSVAVLTEFSNCAACAYTVVLLTNEIAPPYFKIEHAQVNVEDKIHSFEPQQADICGRGEG
jgi:hypothetical protein